MFDRYFVAVVVLLSGLLGSPAWADWQLDPEKSSVNFVSVKNNSVAEVNHFGTLSGAIDAHGRASVSIALDSVETLIAIRNERLRTLLFDTPRYPLALVQLQVDMSALTALAVGSEIRLQASIQLQLHGAVQTLDSSLRVLKVSATQLHVATVQPLIVNASAFKLSGGVAALQAIAGLSSISTAVPVSVYLVFNQR